MAPKKASQAPSPSQEASTKKTKKLSHFPTSYSTQDIKKRASLFSKRPIAPSRFMHEDTLKAIGYFDEVTNLLLVSGLFQFAFSALPSYPSLIIEFLSSFTLRSINYDNDNPYFSMRFKLGGKDRFMTYQEFDTLFGFGQEGHVQTPSHWFGESF